MTDDKPGASAETCERCGWPKGDQVGEYCGAGMRWDLQTGATDDCRERTIAKLRAESEALRSRAMVAEAARMVLVNDMAALADDTEVKTTLGEAVRQRLELLRARVAELDGLLDGERGRIAARRFLAGASDPETPATKPGGTGTELYAERNAMHCRKDEVVCRGESYCACQCNDCKRAYSHGVETPATKEGE